MIHQKEGGQVGKTISHYKILEKLGEGGMGEVYLAEDTKLHRRVALKFLPSNLTADQESRERFEREAQAAAALNHPNIITVHEISEFEGQIYIAMEYVEGESLREIIDNIKATGRTALPIDDVITITNQICEGLEKAHQAGIVHRDIKSGNILIDRDGLVKILDFGLAKLRGVSYLTKESSTLGTVAYMSPEQARGEEVDHRTDIWSLGVVLYEIVTGQLPFKGEYEQAVIYSILNEEPKPMTGLRTGIPMELEHIVGKALEKEIGKRYQRIEEVSRDLKNLKDKPISKSVVKQPFPKPLRRFFVPLLVLLIVGLAILFGIRIQVGRQPPAIAAENRLAVMYFDNLAEPEDPQRLGEIVTNLLIADLSESRYVQVVSSQRLYDILKLLGKEDIKKVNKDVASQVAEKAKAKWMLLGSLLQVEPQIVITSQLVEVETGSAIASQRIVGETDEKIFSLVDKLTVEIKNDLTLPAAAQEEPDRPVAEVTTHSPEAYRYYLEGVDYGFKYYFTEAEKILEKALEFDSTFAMAYYRLAGLKGGPERKKMIAKAVEYSDKVSQKEKYYIKGLEAYLSGNYNQAINELEMIIEHYPEEKEAFYTLGVICYQRLRQLEEAVRHFNKAIEIDPLYKDPYNMLAYTYNDIGDFEQSIWAINKYISLAPDEANPYDSRADLYAFNGKIDQAIESYKKALEIKSDFYPSLAKLGNMYLFKRDYAKAEYYYKELASSSEKDTRSWGRTYLAYIPRYQGKFEGALEVLDQGIGADKMEQAEGGQASKHLLKATIYREKKKLNLAFKEVEKAMQISRGVNPDATVYHRHYYACLLAENNDFEKAEEVAFALKQDIEEKEKTLMWVYWYVVGYIELARRNFEASQINFEKAAKDVPYFYIHFMLAKTYLESGRLGESVAELEKLLSRYDDTRASATIWAVKAHYLLGLAYEKSGWTKKAIKQYEEFLDIWKDAGPGIEVIDDAKERLARLKGIG